jgi:hypothetical protein
LAAERGVDWDDELPGLIPLNLTLRLGKELQAAWGAGAQFVFRYGSGVLIPCDWQIQSDSEGEVLFGRIGVEDFVQSIAIFLGDRYVGAIDRVGDSSVAGQSEDWRATVQSLLNSANRRLPESDAKWSAKCSTLTRAEYLVQPAFRGLRMDSEDWREYVAEVIERPEFEDLLASDFLAQRECRHVESAIRVVVELVKAGRQGATPNLGFLAVAFGVPGASAVFEALGPESDRELLVNYNAALARLLEPRTALPDVLAALDRVIAQSSASNEDEEFRALLEARFDAPDVVRLEVTRFGEGSQSPVRLLDFVHRSRAAIRAAMDSGQSVKVVASAATKQ